MLREFVISDNGMAIGERLRTRVTAASDGSGLP
jgi:hypothetical protein